MYSYRFFVIAAAVFLVSTITGNSLFSQTATPPSELPRFAIGDLEYQGAFRVPASKFGISDMNYSAGPLAYNPTKHSIFIIGNVYQNAIAEFAVPNLVKSSVVADLNTAKAPLQTFADVLDRPTSGAVQSIDCIGGMALIDGELIINTYEYYDAPGDNTVSTLVMRDASNIGTCKVDGYFRFSGAPPAHHAGWISPVPPEWRNDLGGSYITGHSSGIPIISRSTVGPSAFAFNPADLVKKGSVPDPVPTVKLLDFSLSNPLDADLSNASLKNALWTHLSMATFGIVVPGTRTYLTLGYSGGHESGVCYKCTQDNGNLCGGYCTPVAADNYQYYWLWDINDLVKVKKGEMNSWDVKPYNYGKLALPFKGTIGGGSFDTASGMLYLTIKDADREAEYSNPPVIVVYRFKTSGPAIVSKHAAMPVEQNAVILHQVHSTITIMAPNLTRCAIYDRSGRQVADLTSHVRQGRVVWHGAIWPSGTYIVKAVMRNKTFVRQINLIH